MCLVGDSVITLVEIFDPKQYENIISPIMIKGISKVIYIGSKEIMTKAKADSIKQFYKNRKFNAAVEFLYVERDNSVSIKNRLKMIIRQNENCVFDATGGEDVILANVGIIAERFCVPVIRINTSDATFICVHGNYDAVMRDDYELSVSDFITLQGGEILHYNSLNNFTTSLAEDINSVFRINSHDCEAFSAFCNVISEYISHDKKELVIDIEAYNNKVSKLRWDVNKIKDLFISQNLLCEIESSPKHVSYKIKSSAVSDCLSKSGNALEYYTALTLSDFKETFRDIMVGVSMDWGSASTQYDTRNEVDVMAITKNFPVFISCKNGEVRKDALYELDTVSRRLGGSYAKKVMVCTHISKNKSARAHFIKRARDMGIILIFDVHKKSLGEFKHYLSNITR